MSNRTSRATQARTQESREAQVEENYTWETPALLDTKNIPARPGYVQRWVRTELKGKDDQANVFKKVNQGWNPRALSSVEKGKFIPHIDFNGTDVIGIHGMILMERPEAQHKSQAEYNRRTTSNQMRAVEENMFKVQDRDGKMPMKGFVENHSEVSKGRQVQADD